VFLLLLVRFVLGEIVVQGARFFNYLALCLYLLLVLVIGLVSCCCEKKKENKNSKAKRSLSDRFAKITKLPTTFVKKPLFLYTTN
jgi:uncharacterized membrane protein YhaH (DUF805 family)